MFHDQPETLRNTMKACIGVLLGTTTITFCLRCYVRLVIQKKFRIDDYLLLLGVICFYGYSWIVLIATNHGYGYHIEFVVQQNPADLLYGMKLDWISLHFYNVARSCASISFAIFFCSLHPPRVLRIAAIAIGFISVLISIGFECYELFGCKPISYFWERFDNVTNHEGSCIYIPRGVGYLQILNGIDAFTDVVLAILPTFMVWNLTMQRAQKIAVAVLLGLGALPAIATILRAFAFVALMENIADFTYYRYPVSIFCVVEPGIGITVICIAQLRPLMKKFFPKGWQHVVDEEHVPTFGRGSPRRAQPSELADISLVEYSVHRPTLETAVKPTIHYYEEAHFRETTRINDKLEGRSV